MLGLVDKPFDGLYLLFQTRNVNLLFLKQACLRHHAGVFLVFLIQQPVVFIHKTFCRELRLTVFGEHPV